MQKENAIEVKDVTKSFKVYYDKGKNLKDVVVTRGRNRADTRTVLKGISFDVKKGEAIGLVGKNGCGKSTTLKLLTRIIYPDSGTIEMAGRVSSLLELGAGFHPDMSGRENIYLNAAVFGLTRKEIDARVEDIIKFSELEEFIENPVRTYSSGMYMRLAFSVAISVEADILLIDEILAVGDVSFQTKCFEKLKEIKAGGTTIIIVSHSLGQIEKICDRSIWLEEGLIKDEGVPKFVHEKYLATMENRRLDKISRDELEKRQRKQEERDKKNVHSMQPNWSDKAIRLGNGDIRFSVVELRNEKNEESIIFTTGEKMIVHMEYEGKQDGIETYFAVAICRDDGVYCYGTNTQVELEKTICCAKNGTVEMIIPNLTLLPARYFIDIAIRSKDDQALDKIHRVLDFQVKDKKKDFGVMRMETEWKI